MRCARRGFTLVEILIVVVILGILAAIVVPNFVNARDEAAAGTTYSELEKLRRAVDVYMARNANQFPEITAGDGTWGGLVDGTGQYLKSPPYNPYVGGANARTIALNATPDAAYQTTHGWVFDAASGTLWAGSFDANDEPIPQP